MASNGRRHVMHMRIYIYDVPDLHEESMHVNKQDLVQLHHLEIMHVNKHLNVDTSTAGKCSICTDSLGRSATGKL